MTDDGLTEYERQRLAHVARNREYMARLGVLDLAATIAPPEVRSIHWSPYVPVAVVNADP